MKNLGIFFIALLNFLLFIGKFSVGLFTHSVALISDAVNSLTDTINSIVVWWATHVGDQAPDEDHPAGHGRARPLAAFFVAIMTGVLALEIIKEAVIRFINPKTIVQEEYAIAVLLITIFTKGGLSAYEYYKGKKDNNSALLAMSVESRGDVFISLGAIIGIAFAVYGNMPWADPLIALFIGFYVLYTGYEIAKENIDFLMGAAGTEEQHREIAHTINNFDQIVSFHDLRTQHLGENLQVTVHCDVKGEYTLHQWHDLEADISDKIESLPFVERAFVHLDPEHK